MKIISFCNLKGGTGKSLVTYNLAGIISEKEKKKQYFKRILCIDGDPQGNVTNNFAVDRLVVGLKTIVDVFENNVSAKEVIVPTQTPNVSIIPGSLNLTSTELQIVSKAGREHILKYWIEDNKEYLNSNFDYIFFDCPPSSNILCQNIYIVSDAIILVNDVSMNSLEGSEQFCALWRAIRLQLRMGDNVEGFLVNNLDSRIGMSKDFWEYVKKHEEFSSMLLETVIPNNVALKHTELEGKTINYLDKKSKGYDAFKNLEEELYRKGIL